MAPKINYLFSNLPPKLAELPLNEQSLSRYKLID